MLWRSCSTRECRTHTTIGWWVATTTEKVSTSGRTGPRHHARNFLQQDRFVGRRLVLQAHVRWPALEVNTVGTTLVLCVTKKKKTNNNFVSDVRVRLSLQHTPGALLLIPTYTSRYKIQSELGTTGMSALDDTQASREQHQQGAQTKLCSRVLFMWRRVLCTPSLYQILKISAGFTTPCQPDHRGEHLRQLTVWRCIVISL